MDVTKVIILNTKYSISIFFLVIMVSQHSPLFAQQVNEKVLALRKEAVNKIASMVAGVPVILDSPLKEIISPIKKSGDPKVFYNHVLDSAKQSVLDGFGTFGVSAEELELNRAAKAILKLKDSQTKKRKEGEMGKPASSRLIKKAREVFKLFTDKNVPLLEASDSDCSASANDDAVFVTPRRLRPYLEHEKRWTFGHEAIHHLERHISEEHDLKALLKARHGELTIPMQRNLLALSRCNEVRADIKAALTGGLSFALGYEGVMLRDKTKHAESSSSPVDKTHPPLIQRHAVAQLLTQELSLLAQLSKKP